MSHSAATEPGQPRPLAPSPANHWSRAYIEELYDAWKRAPSSLDPSWDLFFQGFELAMCPRRCVAADAARKQSAVAALVDAYRSLGHRKARSNPLGPPPPELAELSLATFGFERGDEQQIFDTGGLVGPRRAPLHQIVATLEATYCGSIGVEYRHIPEPALRTWLEEQMEPTQNRPDAPREQRLMLLELLADAERFEHFLHSRYPGQKRFSLEGAETVIPALHALVELAPELGGEELVLGMSHRGRLNVLANILDKSDSLLFAEFEDVAQPGDVGGSGDVKYHKGYSSDHRNRFGHGVHLSLTANPSHLEAVDPVVEGRTRAKQRQRGDTQERRKVIPVLLHGDAAFAGQGIVAETLNLSKLQGYRTGGTVHLVVNNQIGFTTSPGEARSTHYPTDVAKMVGAPIFHVNADDPEAAVFACELALRFRQRFGRDVVVDLVCYRRHGHNEGDEPSFTQPLLYSSIRERPSTRALYMQQLVDGGVLSAAEAQRFGEEFQARLQQAFDETRHGGGRAQTEEKPAFQGLWQGLGEPYDPRPVESGVAPARLQQIAATLSTVPPGFALNPKVGRHLPGRLEAVREGGEVDWAFAESLAFGSLLLEGTPVRLSGQDSVRGTFSQRHATWQDMNTGEGYTPLAHLSPDQAHFCAYNSLLSEAAVLGFDYGYSLAEPNMLILWEAQFGDFANGAQAIIDQFVTGSLSKWGRASGLVMLLPHGYEGQGPEHSNAYLERYLAACAEDNIQVCSPSTPAQYFHVLRRQMLRPFRRPLVIMSPKSLLRHRRVRSAVAELSQGSFREVIGDPLFPAGAPRAVLCSGKVYYDLYEARAAAGAEVALLRLDQLYPFPAPALRAALAPYAGAELIWAQEEPRNRGAWTFLAEQFAQQLPGQPLPRYAGRPASASSATGSHREHDREQAALVALALGLSE